MSEDEDFAHTRQNLLKAFPEPLPDETLFSVIARFHHRSGIRSPYFTGEVTLNFPKAVLYRGAMKGIGVLCGLLPQYFGTPDQALRSRTLGCLYLRFMSAEKRIRTVDHATANPADGVRRWGRHLHNWLTQQQSREHPLRYCPNCVRADREAFGVAYWHLDHQLPAVWWCLRHSAPLLALIDQRLGEWHLPPQREEAAYAPVSRGAFDLELSRIVVSMRGTSTIYAKHARTELGVLLESWSMISNHFKKIEYLSAIAHRQLTPERLMIAYPIIKVNEDWIRLMVKSATDHHPVKWALLLTALRLEGLPQGELLEALVGSHTPQLPGFQIPRRRARPERADELLATGMSAKQCAHDLSVSRATVESWLKDPELREIWEAARLRLRRNTYREDVLAAINSGRARQRADLRDACTKVLGWMRKHDHEWLERNIPLGYETIGRQIPLPFPDALGRIAGREGHRRAILGAVAPGERPLKAVLMQRVKRSTLWSIRYDTEWFHSVVQPDKVHRLTVMEGVNASGRLRLDPWTNRVLTRIGNSSEVIASEALAAGKALSLRQLETFKICGLSRYAFFSHRDAGKPAHLERWGQALRLIALRDGLVAIASTLPRGITQWMDDYHPELQGTPRFIIQNEKGLFQAVELVETLQTRGSLDAKPKMA